ncbi:aldehyde dehydrogenase [Mycolicibacterium sp. 624]|uniref:aldehyde dehydrogenase n=1 Tax=Mycolicibacterium sp. 624 TaxID=3156314 RepID=UPI003398F915
MTATKRYHVGDRGNYIGGEYTEAHSSARLSVVSPISGETLGTIADSDAVDVAAAVASAQQAFEGEWADVTPAGRARLLDALASAIESRAGELIDAEVEDNGKVVREMRGQIHAVPRWYRYFGGLADKLEGTTVPMESPSLFNYTTREPLGVIGCITPWNSPLLLGAWKFAPALAAGNTVVVKPSEHASMSTLLFAQCFEDAGFPPGVFNVVTGSGSSTGRALVDHHDVRKITFTGSVDGGRLVAERASARLAHVALELGGKSANIVFADASIDAAVNGILAGIFAAAGQTCVAGSRALIHADVYDEVVSRVVERAKSIRVGDPRIQTTEMGPIANVPQLDKVSEYVKIAHGEGAELLVGGTTLTVQGGESGNYFAPTVFGGVTSDMRIFREEVFGPLLCATPFTTDEEAISLANSTEYGLAAGIWTSDVSRAHAVAKHLHAGTVWVNTYRAIAHNMPFGGRRTSGLGRENGLDAVTDFLETKSVWVETAQVTADPFSIKI